MLVASPVPLSKATSFGVTDTDRDGQIRGFLEKPENLPLMPPDSSQTYGSVGNYLFDMGVLLTALHEAKERGENEFGRHFLLRLIHSHRVSVYNFADNRIPGIYRYEEQSYWCDVGDIDPFYAAHHDVIGGESRFNLLNPQWFINSSNYQGPSPRILSGDIQDSVIGAGPLAKCARIHNTILRSEVLVEEDVELEDCVIMDYTIIRRGSCLKRVIVDRHYEITSQSRIGFDVVEDSARYDVSEGGVVVLSALGRHVGERVLPNIGRLA